MLNFGCLGRRAILVAALLGLAACASRSAGWARPNTGEATRDKDYADCRAEAKSVAGTAIGIDQDIEASRGEDWQRSGQYSTRTEQTSGAADSAFSGTLSSCMTDKGYRAR